MDNFIEKFLESFDENRFPEKFLSNYDALECFSHNETGETLLVRERKSSAFYVAKCYTDRTLQSHTTESALLKKLRHRGLPEFAAEYENDHMLCVVREYVEGTPLDQYADNALTEEQAMSIMAQLCDILSYLHGQTPPVIHRDIKPQNIIIGAKGQVRLIDFGISRVYDDAAREDTVCFGTKHYAPPEQYGFSQTDCRADIFSLGVLLCWLLTGEADTKTTLPGIKNKRLRRIIQKCTAFAPERRYASAARVKAALARASGRKSAVRFAYAAMACAVFLCAGFAIGRYTQVPAFLAVSGVSFEEPLIGQAVRLALDKSETEPVAEEELLSVTELYIFGDRAAASAEAYQELNALMAQNDGLLRGGISSLDDLQKLENLRTLSIAYQNIGDVSALGSLVSLEQIDLKHNPIEDISPLAGLKALRDLCVYDTRVSDFSVLADCVMLENIVAGKTQVSSMEAFSGIRHLKLLFLQPTSLETLSGIEAFTKLEQVGISNVADGDLSPLLLLPRLSQVHLDESLKDAAEANLRQAPFQIIYP